MCTLFHTMITHFVLFIFSHRHTATCYRSSQRNSFIFPVLRLSPFIFQLHAIVEMPEHVNTYFIAYFNTSSHKIDSILLHKHLNGSFESYVRSWRNIIPGLNRRHKRCEMSGYEWRGSRRENQLSLEGELNAKIKFNEFFVAAA